MSDASPEHPRTNRWILAAFGVAALVFLVAPVAIRWWGERDICPAEIVVKGRSSGTDWEVAKSDCGPEVGIVWQVRIIPTKGFSTLAFESRKNGPVPTGYDQKGFTGTVRLAEPLPGSGEAAVAVELAPNGRPVAPVRFVGSARVP